MIGLIFRQKYFLFFTPLLITRQPVLPKWLIHIWNNPYSTMLMVCSSVAPRLFILTLSPVKSPWGRFDPPGRSVSLIMAKLLVQCLQLGKYPEKTLCDTCYYHKPPFATEIVKKKVSHYFWPQTLAAAMKERKNYDSVLYLRSQLSIWNWLCILLNSSFLSKIQNVLLYEKNRWK